jgi:soluble lytic murein transglycosylase-like protein
VRKAGASQATAIQFTELVLSVAKVESGLRQDAISRKGAKGLMQLMPQTALGLGVDAGKPEQNALGGAAYLRSLLERYSNNAVLALAAYNAGPGAVQKYGGVPPYAETQLYIERVLREYSRLEQQRRSQRE